MAETVFWQNTCYYFGVRACSSLNSLVFFAAHLVRSYTRKQNMSWEGGAAPPPGGIPIAVPPRGPREGAEGGALGRGALMKLGARWGGARHRAWRRRGSSATASRSSSHRAAAGAVMQCFVMDGVEWGGLG